MNLLTLGDGHKPYLMTSWLTMMRTAEQRQQKIKKSTKHDTHTKDRHKRQTQKTARHGIKRKGDIKFHLALSARGKKGAFSTVVLSIVLA